MTTLLKKFLNTIEESSGALSVQALAKELDVTPERVEGLVDFWVRKGKIRLSQASQSCSSCGLSSNCPFLLELPQTYELVGEGDDGNVEVIQPDCQHLY